MSREIKAGEFSTAPPQYWHRIEVSDDVQFNINFWAESDKRNELLIQVRDKFHREEKSK